jgi:SAM-dependent methyltransferase
LIFNKRYFENVFRREDPWGYRVCQYEKTKHQRQTELIKEKYGNPASILEIGCAEGAHTVTLTETFPNASILAVDISPKAIKRASEACSGKSKVEFKEVDLTRPFSEAGLAGRRFDVVIQSESLYYMFPTLFMKAALLRYLRDLSSTMHPGSVFVTSNGLHLPTKLIVGMFYRMMETRANLIHASMHHEWNEVRSKCETYDIRLYRLRS